MYRDLKENNVKAVNVLVVGLEMKKIKSGRSVSAEKVRRFKRWSMIT